MLNITHFITFCTYETTHLFSFPYLASTDDGKKKARRTADLSKAGDAIEKRARERGLNTEQLTTVIEIITQRNLCKYALGLLTIIHLKIICKLVCSDLALVSGRLCTLSLFQIYPILTCSDIEQYLLERTEMRML